MHDCMLNMTVYENETIFAVINTLKAVVKIRLEPMTSAIPLPCSTN